MEQSFLAHGIIVHKHKGAEGNECKDRASASRGTRPFFVGKKHAFSRAREALRRRYHLGIGIGGWTFR